MIVILPGRHFKDRLVVIRKLPFVIFVIAGCGGERDVRRHAIVHRQRPEIERNVGERNAAMRTGIGRSNNGIERAIGIGPAVGRACPIWVRQIGAGCKIEAHRMRLAGAAIRHHASHAVAAVMVIAREELEGRIEIARRCPFRGHPPHDFLIAGIFRIGRARHGKAV